MPIPLHFSRAAVRPGRALVLGSPDVVELGLAGATALDFFAVDEVAAGPRQPALAHLVLAAKVDEADVHAVNVRRDDGQDEQEAVDHEVGVAPREEKHGRGREDDIED